MPRSQAESGACCVLSRLGSVQVGILEFRKSRYVSQNNGYDFAVILYIVCQ